MLHLYTLLYHKTKSLLYVRVAFCSISLQWGTEYSWSQWLTFSALSLRWKFGEDICFFRGLWAFLAFLAAGNTKNKAKQKSHDKYAVTPSAGQTEQLFYFRPLKKGAESNNEMLKIDEKRVRRSAINRETFPCVSSVYFYHSNCSSDSALKRSHKGLKEVKFTEINMTFFTRSGVISHRKWGPEGIVCSSWVKALWVIFTSHATLTLQINCKLLSTIKKKIHKESIVNVW